MGVGGEFNVTKFWIDEQVLIHGKRSRKWGVGRENLMPMKVGGIVGELFSYLFFIISLFLMILIKLLSHKFYKVNIISYYKIII